LARPGQGVFDLSQQALKLHRLGVEIICARGRGLFAIASHGVSVMMACLRTSRTADIKTGGWLPGRPFLQASGEAG